MLSIMCIPSGVVSEFSYAACLPLAVSRESLDAPDSLWEWHQPWIDHLLWHARTFGRQVVHRYFATWQALDCANTQLWATTYAPATRYALWPTWHVWLVDYRELLVITREVYEGHQGQQ
jgi:hypothetical protein